MKSNIMKIMTKQNNEFINQRVKKAAKRPKGGQKSEAKRKINQKDIHKTKKG